jgi:hypothetical protein
MHTDLRRVWRYQRDNQNKIDLFHIVFPSILFLPNNHLHSWIGATLFLGTVKITSSGTQIIGQKLVLTCAISPFTGTVSWKQDGTVRTICTSTFCSHYTHGSYTTFTYGSNHINVTFDPVDSSIDGLWKCTHTTLGCYGVTVTAMNETISKYSLIN